MPYKLLNMVHIICEHRDLAVICTDDALLLANSTETAKAFKYGKLSRWPSCQCGYDQSHGGKHFHTK